MSDREISQLQINDNTYNLVDATARNDITSLLDITHLTTTTATDWFAKGSNTNIVQVDIYYNKIFAYGRFAVTTSAAISLPASGNCDDIYIGQIMREDLRPPCTIPIAHEDSNRGWFNHIDKNGTIDVFAVNGTGSTSTFASGSSLVLTGWWPLNPS